MRRLLACAALALLPGCAALGSAITALMPVAVSCVPKDAPKPPATLPDADLRKLPDDVFVLTIAAERLDLLGYARQADAVITGCR